MSVLIRGMQMPGGCAFCPIRSHQFCYAAKAFIKKPSMTDRHERCPLIELPPHGRLIDADAIRPYHLHFRKVVMFEDIEAAPTIIEAEEEKGNY